jgi:heme oxygenase
MKTGLFGQQLSLMEELKAATFSAHTRLQTAPFFETLAACQLPLESYIGQLRALSAIHGVIEQALANCTDERIAFVWNNGMGKLPLLQQDLRYFEPRTVADLKEAVEAALNTADELRLVSLEEPISLLGWVYVLEGSTLGAVVVRPMVARALLLAGEDGLAYLHSYGSAIHDRWAEYKQRMNALRLSPEERSQVAQAACQLFDKLETIFRALYPFQPKSKTYLVASINPEAGRHPVPADAGEVQAAVKAGDVCWQRFPYFEQRYGERGRRFARSDAAWQATLYQYPAAQIIQQVQWLGRVLAGRGMPTLLLQVQLEILVAELVAATPGKKSDYEKLLPAAAELHAARCKHLTDEQIETVAGDFESAVGPEWSTRLPNTGALLCAAVADELEGNTNAVKSLRSWMTDTERFPANWIAVVEATLTRARQEARP